MLASTSTLPDEKYLAYLLPELEIFFKNTSTITFIPYARPNGISHDHYTRHVAQAFSKIGKKVKGLHEYKDPIAGNCSLSWLAGSACLDGGLGAKG